jgi:hypothetical protein
LRGLITDNAYQVTSEEAGIIPLDMIVGSRCLMERKAFNLHAEEINLMDQINFSSTPKESPFAIRNLISTLETRAR